MSDRRKPLPSKRGSNAPTLGDVSDAVAASTHLNPVRIRDLISAISCFGTLIGEEAKSIPLDLAAIAARLGAVNPIAVGISPKRLANIRSDLFAAIAASGLIPARRTRQALTGPWEALRTKLATERQRIGLSRLCQYASAAGLRPTDIGSGVIDEFITVIREQSLHRKPNDLHRQTAMIWNEVVGQFPEFGLHPVDVPSFRAPSRRIDVSGLPGSFKSDMEDYLTWCTSTDPFATNARARPLARATVKLRRDQIHTAATALAESGVERENITSLADLVTVANFRIIARDRLDRADGKANSFNHGLAGALMQIAREWVKIDAATLAELKRLASKLPAPRGDLVAKNKHFLRQFDDPVVLQRLTNMPARLWSQVRREGSGNFRTLALAQAALGLEILIYMPIRMQNLAKLEFDKHLFLHTGRGAISTLDIPAEEVKNRRPIEFDIPPHVARMMIEYRDHIAPKIIGRKTARLFVNHDGTPKHPQTLSKLIGRMVRRYVGVELSPHQLRHLAAKILLDESPGAFELVKQLLGHENLKTTVNAYAGIDTRRASRHHYRLLEKMSAEQLLALPRSLAKPNKHRHKKKE
jgi:integrase